MAFSERHESTRISSFPSFVREDAGSVRIEGIPPMRFGEGTDCSFIRSVQLALARLGRRYTYPFLMGLSGAAFRLHFHPDWFPGSGDVTAGFDVSRPLFRALGQEAETVAIDDNRFTGIKSFYNRISGQINRGIPVLAINLRVGPEWGIITGYLKKNPGLLCRTFFDESDAYSHADRAPWLSLFLSVEESPSRDKEPAAGPLQDGESSMSQDSLREGNTSVSQNSLRGGDPAASPLQDGESSTSQDSLRDGDTSVSQDSLRDGDTSVKQDSLRDGDTSVKQDSLRHDDNPANQDLLQDSLRQAVRLLETDQFGEYASGIAAYLYWIGELEDLDPVHDASGFARKMEVNRMLLDLLLDARRSAFHFLQETGAAKRVPGGAEITRKYEILYALLDKTTAKELPPAGSDPGRWTGTIIQRQISLLSEAMVLEKEAIGLIRKKNKNFIS